MSDNTLSFGTWKSKVDGILQKNSRMCLKDFPDYPFFKDEWLDGFEPYQTAVHILDYYGFKMKFD